jgi:hypothetical protein
MLIKTKTSTILKAMRIIAWIAFIGLMVQAGAILISGIITFNNPAGANDFYDHMDVSKLLSFSPLHFAGFVFFLASTSVLKSIVWYLVIKCLTGFNLTQPFTMTVVKRLEQISILLLAVWGLGVFANGHMNYILFEIGDFIGEKAGGEFLFMAGLVYVISQIFKRGVEIQAENELTV